MRGNRIFFYNNVFFQDRRARIPRGSISWKLTNLTDPVSVPPRCRAASSGNGIKVPSAIDYRGSRRKHCQEHGRQHVGDTDFLAPDKVDSDTEKSEWIRPGRRGWQWRPLVINGEDQARQQSDASLKEKDRDRGKSTALAHGGRHDHNDDKVEHRFYCQGREVPHDAVLDRADDGYGADADGEGAGHESVHKPRVFGIAGFDLAPGAKPSRPQSSKALR